MRVIGGAYRSRVLTAPRGQATRPTSDRLRETLFNILAPRIAGARFADLYAGSGAVAIEALSRGAAHVFLAERSVPALAAIRKNLATLNLTTGFTLEPRGVAALLTTLSTATPPSAPLDLVFLDPPWESAAAYDTTLRALGDQPGDRLHTLAPHALVIAEHAARTQLAPRFGRLAQTRTLQQGDAALTFYELAV